MKVFILGATGMLGHKLCQKLKDEFEVHATIRGDFDRYRSLPVFEGVKIVRNIFVENTQLLYTTLSKIKPDVIINAGLWYWSGNSITPYIGYQYNHLQLGLSYDLTISKLRDAPKRANSFELSIILRGEKPKTGVIPCPWK